MEPINPHSLVTFSVLFIFFIMALFVIGWYLVYWGKSSLAKDNLNELKYKLEYREIQDHIKTYSVDLGMYYKIKDEIRRLGEYEYKNPEKTSMLHLELCTSRFYKIALSIAENRVIKK